MRTLRPPVIKSAPASARRLGVVLPLASFLMLFAVLASLSLSTGHDWGDDFASYIMQGRALSEGSPTAFAAANAKTTGDSTIIIGPSVYPWGLPLVYAFVNKAFGGGLLQYKAVNIAFYLLFLAAGALYCLKRLNTRHWMLFAALFAFNPWCIAFLDNALSDIPYLALSFLTVVYAKRVLVERRTLISAYADMCLLGLLTGGAMLLRTEGGVLLPVLALTVLGESLLPGRREKLATPDAEGASESYPPSALFCLFLSAGATVALHRLLLPQPEGDYLRELAGTNLHEIAGNFSYYAALPAEFFHVSGFPGAESIALAADLLYPVLVICALWGAASRLKADYPALLFCAFSVALHIAWPSRQGLRFILPVLPFFIFFLLVGLEKAKTALGRWGGAASLSGTALLALLALAFLYADVLAARDNLARDRALPDGPYTRTFSEIADFIREKTPGDSRIVFSKPRALAMLTGRKSRVVGSTALLAPGDDFLCVRKRHAYRDQPGEAEVKALVSSGRATEVLSNRDFSLYSLSTHRQGHL